ncbi:MAG: DHH family phosphoesterase [Candidatus Improbicoccus devescovinae]|nr:MAG: DHH family phosphoesterase [Candidatus Improbicoccus devescovinae]
MNIFLEKILEILCKQDNFHIIVHMFPDGDAIGSAVALCRALQNLGKKAWVISPTAIPEKFLFMLKYIQKYDIIYENFVSICVDVASLSRIRGLNYSKIDICIDHHITNENYADVTYNNTSAANTENIYKLLENLCNIQPENINLIIDNYVAECIYIGIITDTGRFKYTNVTKNTFKIAYNICEMIQNFEDLNRKIFYDYSINFVKFKHNFLNKAEYFFDNSCILGTVLLKDMEYFGVNYDELANISSMFLDIKDVKIGIVLKEKENKIFKVSVRTKKNINTLKICTFFGGGGHENACGFEVSGELENIKTEILVKLSEYVFLDK